MIGRNDLVGQRIQYAKRDGDHRCTHHERQVYLVNESVGGADIYDDHGYQIIEGQGQILKQKESPRRLIGCQI